ncbi:winged helix-turn-helix transcriptional regulator [Rubellimicrobium arenae]|uniref:winged helix-turn-helix transcriptional regulator n=1 Tax=Rubellimicrobium arenae TaxID=2817372 RepID=UPI001B315AD3|nr:helix-turn-helix domain-containing protein [Rubellimicrobium arenae]
MTEARETQDSRPLFDSAGPRICFHAALKLLTGKWKAEILWSLREGKLRFGELMRSIPGITQHMLTTQLRELERHGLVTRTVFPEVPPRVEYELTEAARDLRIVFEAIRHWSEKHGDSLNLEADFDDVEEKPAVPSRLG